LTPDSLGDSKVKVGLFDDRFGVDEFCGVSSLHPKIITIVIKMKSNLFMAGTLI